MKAKLVVELLVSVVLVGCVLSVTLALLTSMIIIDPDPDHDSTEAAAIKFNVNCFEDNNCESESGTVAVDFNDCCFEKLALSYQNLTTNTCLACLVTRQTAVIGDPHFIVPLQSGKILCYSIQGYPGLAFNLIHSKTIIINAQFVDSVGDTNEATWIGKLAVISQHVHKTQIVIFDSVNKEVIIFGYGKIKAAVIKSVTFYEHGKVKYLQAIKKQVSNPTVHVEYIKEQASFDVEFHKNHLDVNWNLQYDKLHELDGLIGQLIQTAIEIDVTREIMIFSDGRLPLPVINDLSITSGNNKQCWRVSNHGNQGEGLIQGNIMDYIVPHILDNKKKQLQLFGS